jgi:hypothetical protein
MLAKIPPAPPSAPDSALAIGPRMKRRAASLARSAIIDVTRSRKSSLPVFTNSPTAFSAEVKAPTSALADIAADVARLGGVVGQRGRDGLPAGEGRIRAFRRCGPGLARSPARTIGGGGRASSSAVSRAPPQACASVSASALGLVGAAHRILQGLPAFEGRASPFRQIARGAPIDIRGLERPVRRLGQAEVGRGQRVRSSKARSNGILRRRRGCTVAAPSKGFDLAEFEVEAPARCAAPIPSASSRR